MSDLPNIYAVRPHELREHAMEWSVEVYDHLTTEDPTDGYKPGGTLPAK